MIFLALRKIRASPSGRPSTAAALAAAAGVALAGAVLWGLISLLFHVQLSLLGVLIGAGVGAMVARYRPGHRPAMIAGAVIAVAGCALGTLLGEVFYLLQQHVTMAEILGHLNVVFRDYPGNVSALGWLFFAIAAFTAIRVPLSSQRQAGRPIPASYGQPGYGQPDFGSSGSGQPGFGVPVTGPAPMTGPSPAPANPGTGSAQDSSDPR